MVKTFVLTKQEMYRQKHLLPTLFEEFPHKIYARERKGVEVYDPIVQLKIDGVIYQIISGKSWKERYKKTGTAK